MGALASKKIFLTAVEISGPIPSPGNKVAVIGSSDEEYNCPWKDSGILRKLAVDVLSILAQWSEPSPHFIAEMRLLSFPNH